MCLLTLVLHLYGLMWQLQQADQFQYSKMPCNNTKIELLQCHSDPPMQNVDRYTPHPVSGGVSWRNRERAVTVGRREWGNSSSSDLNQDHISSFPGHLTLPSFSPHTSKIDGPETQRWPEALPLNFLWLACWLPSFHLSM